MRIRFALILLSALAATACDDDLGLQPWDATPQNITLFSLSRDDLLGRPSGYDFVTRQVVQLEQPGTSGSWDVALAGGNGQLQLIPAPAFEGLASSRAAVAPIGNTTYEQLLEAPSDTAQYLRTPVNVTLNGVYVVRSRRATCGYTSGSRFGKIKAVAVDAVSGIATFAVVVNPYCGDRSFVPPED